MVTFLTQKTLVTHFERLWYESYVTNNNNIILLFHVLLVFGSWKFESETKIYFCKLLLYNYNYGINSYWSWYL